MPSDQDVESLAKVLAEANGMPWSQLIDAGSGNMSRAVASKAFYRRLATAALLYKPR